ncbi:hypothetical protein [Streptomyces sp. NPDC046909]|uniref:hypothetical protein n=1 Tax=Streptomyces sp. NPDC046909 TaxID=3155617 RepID=UPI0033F9E453
MAPVEGGWVDGVPDSTGLVLGEPVGSEPLSDGDGVLPGLLELLPVGALGDPPSPGDEAVPDVDGVGTGRPGTSVGEPDGTPGDTELPGRSGLTVGRTVPGSLDGTPGTGSSVLGANGVAPMKLRNSTIV